MDPGALKRRAPFCRLARDTNCSVSLILFADETQSHELRQFSESQILYVVEIALLFNHPSCGKDWQPPCYISRMRDFETRYAFGGARRDEGLMK